MRQLSLGEVSSVGGGCDETYISISELRASAELARAAAAGDMDAIAQGNAAITKFTTAQYDYAAMKCRADKAMAAAMKRHIDQAMDAAMRRHAA